MKIIRNTQLSLFTQNIRKTENAGQVGGRVYTLGKTNARVLISLASPCRLTLDT